MRHIDVVNSDIRSSATQNVAWPTRAQKRRFLQPLRKSDYYWCHTVRDVLYEICIPSDLRGDKPVAVQYTCAVQYKLLGDTKKRT